jgi:hypothetical protein
MNSYITLDGKKYQTLQKNWLPETQKSMTTRLTLAGSLDVTFGPGSIKIWSGEIKARVSPATGYGSPSDLRTSLDKLTGLSFTDHLGNSYTVYTQGYKERSYTPVWDGTSNLINFSVRLVGK